MSLPSCATLESSFSERGLLRDVHHEAAVDLELGEGQRLQVAQRRIAGAEIVERDADAALAERRQDGGGRVALLDQRRLGDLDLEPVRRQAAGSAARVGTISSTSSLRKSRAETLTETEMSSGQLQAFGRRRAQHPAA